MSPLGCVLLIVSTAVQLAAGEKTVNEKGLQFTISNCVSPGAPRPVCLPETTELVLDYELSCDDPTTCYEVPSRDVYEKVAGVYVNGGQVNFTFPFGLNRVYVTGGDEYRMFYLLNHELTFDVDMSTVGCGLNAAFYLSSIPADGGRARFNYTGAAYGTGNCYGQDDPPNCLEMDVWEANSLATMLTIHPCNETNCNGYGCGVNMYPLGHKEFYGRGSNFTLDSTRPFTVVTRFPTINGTDDGDLLEIRQFFVQDGRKIELPPIEGGFTSLSDAFCDYHYVPTLEPGYEFFGVTAGMTQGMRDGMVLVLSFWGDPLNDGMQWLDMEPYGPCPIYNNADAYVTFSNVRFGPIGSTV